MTKLLSNGIHSWLIVRIGEQQFALSVQTVQGVLRQLNCESVPLAPPEVVGTMNLRGRIVTMLDVGCRLGMCPRPDIGQWKMGVVIERGNFLYCILVDEVGEVMLLPQEHIVAAPSNLGADLKRYANGVYRQKKALFIMLDVKTLLDYEK